MTDDKAPRPGETDRLGELIEILHQTHRQIREIAGETVDAVVHPASGTSYLLVQAQGDLRRKEGVERRHAAERAAILDALPAQIALLDLEGRIVAVNESWRRFARENALADNEFSVGRSYLEICDSAAGPNSGEAGAVADGIRDVLSGRADRYTLKYPCHAPDVQRWFLLTATPLGRDQPSGAVVMHVDISERYRAHERAGEWQRRLERLIDQARVGIMVHRDFAPILVNRELARLFGYEHPDDIMTLADLKVLFADHERGRVTGYNETRLAGGEAPAVYQMEGKRRDGAKLVLENRAFTIRWGEHTAVCAMFTDITAQLELEEQFRQAQRLEIVGQLTGGIAHDFNNLLTVILGNAELLVEGLAADRELRILAEMSAKAAERGAELTSRLLAFARRQPLDPKPTDVNLRIADMDRLLRRTLGEHIVIDRMHAVGLWQALIDSGQMENAILNLCINARDAMPGGGRLTIETANVRLDDAYAERQGDVEPGQYVMVAISDTGTGMDPKALERAFEPFFTTKEVGKGSGLGLSMVYGFVKQSRGHIRIYSELGQGTTVKLYLPRANAGDDPGVEALAEATIRPGTEKILLVEDDELVRRHVAAQLEGLGYRVVTAANAREALKELGRHDDVDLLFTDIVMPGGMTGRQLADEVRKSWPNLPVLFTSGYSENAIVHHGRLDPGVDFLSKPYRRQDLAAKLRLVLARGAVDERSA